MMRINYSPKDIDQWLSQYPGKLIYEMAGEQLKNLLSHTFGEFLVQIGGSTEFGLLNHSPIPQKIYLNPIAKEFYDKPQIQAQAEELPLAPNSINVVLVSHFLEFTQHPKIFLNQIYQALVPNGQLIIIGFNPLSSYGMEQWFHRSQKFPHGRKFCLISEIKHWLRALDFRIITSKTFCFRPPLKNENTLKRLLFMEALGQICTPGLGGSYIILAQKMVHGMIPLREHWWSRGVPISNGYIKPSTRNIING